MNTWIKKARYPILVIFLAKLRRKKRFGQFGESTCVLGHESTMDNNWNKLVSSLPCPQNSQNGQSPLLSVANTGWQSSDPTGHLCSPGSSAEAGTRSQPCALSTGGYRHWTGLQMFCCFFCPVKHKDGQSVTITEFFFHFFCSILAVFWSKYKLEIMPRCPSLFSSKQQLQLLLPGNFLLF